MSKIAPKSLERFHYAMTVFEIQSNQKIQDRLCRFLKLTKTI